MKLKYLIIPLAVSICAACNQSGKDTSDIDTTRSTTNADHNQDGKSMFARMQIGKPLHNTDSVILNFTVYNPADTAQKFCKWHTPFEPLLSNYLSIKNQKGEEAPYKGPMAKRMMPPPEDSYISVNPKESLNIGVDLLKAYDLKKGNKYTVSYSGENMSGLTVKDTISFEYRGKR